MHCLILDTSQEHSEINHVTINSNEGENFVDNVKSSNNELSSNSIDIQSDLINWALTHNINHIQLRSLLRVLTKWHPELPSDSRTLLKTERKLNLKCMLSSRGTKGKFIYFGITHSLELEFRNGYYSLLKSSNCSDIELILNTDGIPIYKSTPSQF